MITINAAQGSAEWYAHRKPPMRNASESPNVMGEGYVSRSEFMRQWVTGVAPEIDAATQARFDKGHHFERLAMPLAEEIIGESLYPVVGVDGVYSASFDGLTMGEDTAYEHKTLNDSIRSCKSAVDLPALYRIQMEHQLMVSGAQKCLFLATLWNDADELVEKLELWYEPDLKLRQQICAAWEQFVADAATYVPPEVIPAAVAAPVLALPAVSIKVDGAVALTSNLGVFLAELKRFIADIPEKPSTDTDFANCKAACKTLQEAQDALDAAEANALGQVASFEQMKRAKALCFDLARNTRLALEKLVVAREKAIKEDIVAVGKQAFADHIARLNARLGRPLMPLVPVDFNAAIKSKRTIESLRNAVDTALADGKIRASAIADAIQINLGTITNHGVDHPFLFADVAQLVLKDADAVMAIVKSRVSEHEAAKAKAEQETRDRIRAEEQAKAKQEAEAKAKEDADKLVAAAKAETARLRAIEEAEYATKLAEQEAATKAAAQEQERIAAETKGSAVRSCESIDGTASLATANCRLPPIPAQLANSVSASPDGLARLLNKVHDELLLCTPGQLQSVLDFCRELRASKAA